MIFLATFWLTFASGRAFCTTLVIQKINPLPHITVHIPPIFVLIQLEAASTHKSAKTHTGTVLNGFPRLGMEHFYVKFDDPSCIVFSRYGAEKQTHRQTAVYTIPPPLLSACVIDPRTSGLAGSWLRSIVCDFRSEHCLASLCSCDEIRVLRFAVIFLSLVHCCVLQPFIIIMCCTRWHRKTWPLVIVDQKSCG